MNTSKKSDGKRHQRKEEGDTSPCKKAEGVTSRKDQPSKSSKVNDKASNNKKLGGLKGCNLSDESGDKAVSPQEGSSREEQEMDNLLQTPSTTSLCDGILEGASQPVEEVMMCESSLNEVEAESRQRKESRANSMCSLQSVSSYNPSHSLVITGSDGSLREVDKNRPTTRSECGSMHMIPQGRNLADGGDIHTVLPVTVQFE